MSRQQGQPAHTTAAIVNFTQNFAAVQHPTASLLHRQPGRSVRHNLHRLTSPEPTHDFRTSILLGGNHPQNQFRYLLNKKSKALQAEAEAEALVQERRSRMESVDFGALKTESTSVDGGSTFNGSRPGTGGGGDPQWGGPDDLASYFADGGPDRRVSLMGGMAKIQLAEQSAKHKAGGGGSKEGSSRPGTSSSVESHPFARSNSGGHRASSVGPQQQQRSTTSMAKSRPPLGPPSPTASHEARGAGAQGVRSLQSRHAATAPAPSGPPRTMTPGPMGGGRSGTAEASGAAGGGKVHPSHPAKSPTNSYLQTKPPTDYVKKNRDVAFQRPMTQQATKTAMSRFEEKWKNKRSSDGTDFGDFSLQINGDYETPFVAQLPEIEKPAWTTKELTTFERRRKGPRTLTTMPATTFSPPKVIVMMFRFSNVRNLRVTKSLRKVGYPELHEQFSTTSKSGTISKVQFHQVCAKYLSAVDLLDCLRILECFDRNALGDVDLNMLLIGLQILLECAAPGDAMRFCFTLMDTTNKIPRYITRYEVQTLVTYASAFAGEEGDAMDGEYLMMGKSIEELLLENHRYDYMGRMTLQEFLKALDQKVADKAADAKKNDKKKQAAQLRLNHNARGATSPGPQTPDKDPLERSQFMFGKAWSGGAGVTAVHRMSSKKMIVASLMHEGPIQ